MRTTMKLYAFKGDLVSKASIFIGNIFVELASTVKEWGKQNVNIHPWNVEIEENSYEPWKKRRQKSTYQNYARQKRFALSIEIKKESIISLHLVGEAENYENALDDWDVKQTCNDKIALLMIGT